MTTQQTSESNHETQFDAFSLTSVLRTIGVSASPTPSEAPEPSIPQPVDEEFDCAVHTLYQGPQKCGCCINWVEDYPDDLRILVEELPDVKQKALIIRRAKSHKDNQVLSLHSIVVHSPSLKRTLREVFKGFEGVMPSLKKLIFKAPFTPFYYRWQTLEKILERQKKSDPGSAKYTQLLHDALEKELREDISEVKDLLENKVMTYSLVWTLFEPGVLCVTAEEDDERFLIATSCDYNQEKRQLNVRVRFVDWDGERFGYSDLLFCMNEYAGMRPITDLGLYPVKFHETREASIAKAMERGRKFRDLRKFHYVAYSGPLQTASSHRDGLEELQLNCDGRVIIDAGAYYRENPGARRKLAALTSTTTAPNLSDEDDEHGDLYSSWESKDSFHYPFDRTYGLARIEVHPKQGSAYEYDLTDEQLVVCNPKVLGYSLKWKIWASFRVNDIMDIEFNSDAFDKMILPLGYKSLILSLIEGMMKSQFEDMIQGKGLGNILLLVGNPGIGKTLTAEALADKLRKPLYVLSAGELGQTASELELKLRMVLELAAKWDAVLLFDECDVFLQERSTAQLAHNEIVAVFLRLLEYYRGILFMTTNRNNAIDPAFKSRIHMTLHYPDLAPEAKSELLRRFAQSGTERSTTEKHTLSDNDFKELALLPMNGREIKNVIKVAGLLACQEGKKLGRDQIDTVLRSTGVIDPVTVNDTRIGLWSAAGLLIFGLVLLSSILLA